MSTYYGTKKSLESQWKAIFKKRVKKTGMSDLLRKVDLGLESTKYDRKDFTDRVLTRSNDAERFIKGLEDNRKLIRSLGEKIKDKTDKEINFLAKLDIDLTSEAQYWAMMARKMKEQGK